MAEIAVELVAVERRLWSGQATMVTAETTEGEIGILPGRVPMLGKLTEHGVVVIRPVEGEKMVAVIEGGFLSVSPEKVTILADEARWVDEIDRSSAESNQNSDDADAKARALAEQKAIRRGQES